MKRRTVLAFLSAASGLLALPAFGQKRMPRVAFFSPAAEDVVAVWAKGFHEALGGLRYENGRNIVLEVVMGAFSRERTEQLAAELIASRPAIIVTPGFAALLLAGLTKEIPIVTAYSGDLVDSGLAKSLARPGGNVTGVQLLDLELVGKRVEILKEIMPRLERLAVVASPHHPGEPRERHATTVAAQRLGIAVSYHPVKNASELEGGLEALRRADAQAIVSFPDGISLPFREKIAAFALRHKIATASGWDVYAAAGHLVSYGPNVRATYGRLAHYVDRILKGADPASLAVELPTTFQLTVNLKSAGALGLHVPQSVLLRADRVIE